MLQAAEGSPRRLQTLSQVLSVNLLSSVRSTGHQRQSCQSLCSLANAKHPARCWAASTTLTCGCRALMESVPDRLSRRAHLWPAGGHFARLWPFFPTAQYLPLPLVSYSFTYSLMTVVFLDMQFHLLWGESLARVHSGTVSSPVCWHAS